ncbi:hypothetical protein chiPu_0032290 [Chiloscyllium punctatum]|uniref:Uncharacterized protein n=1 Tax=Chiloscyllium punctatum TaxID=137246 RepID=A0A401TZQ9_CHIPU|nr:hypothetical protein [Chiloscyllium punctatum]
MADNRPRLPFAVHAEPRIGRLRNLRRCRHPPVRRRPHVARRIFRPAQQLAGGARHAGAARDELGLDHLDAEPVAHEPGRHLDRRRDVGQPEHVDGQPRGDEIVGAVALLDDEAEQADHDAAVHRFRAPGAVGN